MRSTSTLAFAAFLLLPVAAQAAPEPYVGAQALLSRTSCEGYEQGFAPLHLTASCDVTSYGFRGYAGVNITDMFGLQVGYQNAGKANVNALAPTGALAFSTETSLKAWDVVATLRGEVGGGAYVVGRAGIAHWTYDVVPDRDLGGFAPSNDGNSFTFGAGVEWRYFTAGYDAILKVGEGNQLAPTAPEIKQTIHRFSVGLRYTFGE
jgi:hypothetical protein